MILMNTYIIVSLLLCLIFTVQSAVGNVRGYDSFEEYLEHVSTALSESSTDDDSAVGITSSSNELLGYFSIVPREHWSCCMLGLLAGSKGFHCQAQYYLRSGDAAQRNDNRAQTDRQPGAHGRHRDLAGPRWSYSISRSFHRCVGGDTSRRLTADDGVADEFHSCCYAATEERRQLRRARRYRRHHQVAERR